jgi:hypothetical protein
MKITETDINGKDLFVGDKVFVSNTGYLQYGVIIHQTDCGTLMIRTHTTDVINGYKRRVSCNNIKYMVAKVKSFD